MPGAMVLVVEDNEKNMKLFRDVLQATGYSTLEASTASSRRTFAGTSSTTRILGARSATAAVLRDGAKQLDHVHRLREVAVEAGLHEPLAVAVHRLRRQGEHGN